MRSTLRRFALLPLAALAAACSDVSQPEAWTPTGPRQAVVIGPVAEPFTVLQRTTPLAAPIVRSAVIDKAGGYIDIPETGFRITFRSKAVMTPTLITVTALPGTGVAYSFEPHGLVFRYPPMILQQLRGTEAFRNYGMASSLQGAYVESLGLGTLDLLAGGTALTTEARPGLVDAGVAKLRFQIAHFSGYIASHGRASAD